MSTGRVSKLCSGKTKRKAKKSTTSGAAGNGLYTTIKYMRGASGIGMGTTIKHL